MTLPATQSIDGNGRTIEATGWDATNHQSTIQQTGPGVADSSNPNVLYAPSLHSLVAATPTSAPLQNAATGTGNGTDFDITGMATLVLLITTADSYTGTVTFNASPDGTTFDVIRGNKQGTTTIATSVAVSGASIWTFQVAGLKKFRASIAGDNTNHVTVLGIASPFPNSVPLGVTLSSAVLAAGSAEIGKAVIEYAAATAAATDQAGTQPQVSLYVKKTTAGDTVLALGQATAANSLPVTLASDQDGGDITVLSSASRTTTQTQADQTNTRARGLRVVLDMTVVTASPSVTLEIDAKDAISGKYTALLTGAAVTTITTNVYEVYPGLTPSANAVVSDVLPHTWRVKVTANNANAGTYSVGASYLY